MSETRPSMLPPSPASTLSPPPEDDPHATAESYAGRILGLMKDRPRYEVMAHAAAARSASMLNWDVAGREAVARIAAVAGVVGGRRERPQRMALTPI